VTRFCASVVVPGRAVNVAFAVVFGAILTAQGTGPGLPVADASVDASLEGAAVPDAPFLLRMFWVNVSLAVFNLLLLAEYHLQELQSVWQLLMVRWHRVRLAKLMRCAFPVKSY
jgi:hypothetical protein